MLEQFSDAPVLHHTYNLRSHFVCVCICTNALKYTIL
jgi:hypothetical protein